VSKRKGRKGAGPVVIAARDKKRRKKGERESLLPIYIPRTRERRDGKRNFRHSGEGKKKKERRKKGERAADLPQVDSQSLQRRRKRGKKGTGTAAVRREREEKKPTIQLL